MTDAPETPRQRLISAACDIAYFDSQITELDAVLSDAMTDLNHTRGKLHAAHEAFDAVLAELKAVA
jgi:hypothetical protein